ncbi:MAG TPA: acyltransferase [Kofleriaceae bacterium]|nr:acyltransferase [Kofleriaceae bacterium]
MTAGLTPALGPASGPAPAGARYAFVDALRGIAATWVVLFHGYNKNLVPMTGYRLPQPFDAVFNGGYLGVYIFFVISGFVITQSIRDARVTPRFIGRFAVRRSLRLDPPYWATIVAMIALSYVSGRLQHDHAPLPLPTAGAIVAHLFYLQAFLGYPQIVGVFWTLCYEIQFYLVLAIVVGVVQWKLAVLRSRWTLFAPLWLVAALCIAGVLDPTLALFVYGWPYFFLGVVVNWVHNRKEPALALAIVALGTAALIPFAAPRAIVALCTAGAIYGASVYGLLARWTLGRVLQYLGWISYSLYLVHMLVGTPLVRFGLRHLGKMDFAHALILMVLELAVSIAAAHVLYLAIERPAVRWSHRLVRLQG